jgi:hypothetical protein
MRLYKVKWYVNGVLTEVKEEAYWADSELKERYDKLINGISNIVGYEYEFIKEIKLPNLF